MKLLLIAFGGALGSVLRYFVVATAHKHTAAATVRAFGHAFPLGTLAVNLIGCLLIGVVAAMFNRNLLPHEPYRLALTVGVLGGFTTFSAFGLDTVTLLQHGHSWLALANILANVLLGLMAVSVGFWLVGLFPPTSS
jgi:CrcB protein